MSHHLRKLKPLERTLIEGLVEQVDTLKADNARLREALGRIADDCGATSQSRDRADDALKGGG